VAIRKATYVFIKYIISNVYTLYYGKAAGENITVGRWIIFIFILNYAIAIIIIAIIILNHR